MKKMGNMQSSPGGMKEIWHIAGPEYGDLCYLFNRSEKRLLECDRSASALLINVLKYRKSIVLKLEGQSFLKGDDLLIRLVSVTRTLAGTQEFLGHFLELEYLPMTYVGADDGTISTAADSPMLQALADVISDQLSQVLEQRRSERRAKIARAAEANSLTLDTSDSFYNLSLEPLVLDFNDYQISTAIPFGRTHAAASYIAMVTNMSNKL